MCVVLCAVLLFEAAPLRCAPDDTFVLGKDVALRNALGTCLANHLQATLPAHSQAPALLAIILGRLVGGGATLLGGCRALGNNLLVILARRFAALRAAVDFLAGSRLLVVLFIATAAATALATTLAALTLAARLRLPALPGTE